MPRLYGGGASSWGVWGGGPGEPLGGLADALPLALRCDPRLQPGHESRATDLGELLQPLRQTGDFSVLGAQSGLAPSQPGLSSGDSTFVPALAALIGHWLGAVGCAALKCVGSTGQFGAAVGA